jgi:hypothetical protein
MKKEQLIKTLLQLHQLLQPVNGEWLIIGTSSLMLSGYDVEPDDVDILTDKLTALHMDMLLKQYRQPVHLKDEGKFRSLFSRYVIDSVSIELMGNLQVNTAEGWVDLFPLITETDEVVINGKLFNVPSKTDQIKIYTLFGRPKDETAIKLLSLT